MKNKKKILLLISIAKLVQKGLSVKKSVAEKVVLDYCQSLKESDLKSMRKAFANNTTGVSYDLTKEIETPYFDSVNSFLIDNLTHLDYKLINIKSKENNRYTAKVEFGHVNANNIIEDVITSIVSQEKDITPENRDKFVQALFAKEKAKLEQEKLSTKVVFDVGKTKKGYKILSVSKDLDTVYTSNYFN